jgi:uncharacterized membrane protein
MELVDSFGVFDNPRADVEGRGEGAGGWSGNNRLGSCGSAGGGGGGLLGLLVDCTMVPDGVVTVMTSDDCASEPTSMRYPAGRKVLNPWMREG